MLRPNHKSKITLSLRNGVFIPFLYKNKQIVVHNASWSFKEKIWVDDELIVNQIGLGRISTHRVNIEDEQLIITFGYREGLSEIFLEAKKNNELVYSTYKKIRNKKASFQNIAITIAMAFLGAVFGYFVVGMVI